MFLFTCRDATGMVLHKDSKWYQQWQEFKDNNPVVTGTYSTILLLCESKPGNFRCCNVLLWNDFRTEE